MNTVSFEAKAKSTSQNSFRTYVGHVLISLLGEKQNRKIKATQTEFHQEFQ